MSDRKIDWSKTALLVIDMQRAFVEPDQPLCVTGAAATVPALTITVNDARKSGSLIVWIRREYKADGSDMEAFRREKMRTNGTLNVMAEGSYGAQPVAGLEGEPGDPVVIKKPHHIGKVVIAGTQTPNCVRATAFDAVSFDYRTIILSDCTSSANADVQRSNLEDMRAAGVEIW